MEGPRKDRKHSKLKKIGRWWSGNRYKANRIGNLMGIYKEGNLKRNGRRIEEWQRKWRSKELEFVEKEKGKE